MSALFPLDIIGEDYMGSIGNIVLLEYFSGN